MHKSTRVLSREDKWIWTWRQHVTNVGLNVAPPLLQSAVVDDVRKIQFTTDISQSQDPGVRQWVSVRQAQRPQWKNTLRHARQSGAVLDCIGAL